MANMYRNRNDGKYPSGPMLGDIEDSCVYLVQLAETSNVDLNKVLNHATKNGTTLFFQASFYSEAITKLLLEKNVKTNSIDTFFSTPSFRVS